MKQYHILYGGHLENCRSTEHNVHESYYAKYIIIVLLYYYSIIILLLHVYYIILLMLFAVDRSRPTPVCIHREYRRIARSGKVSETCGKHKESC